MAQYAKQLEIYYHVNPYQVQHSEDKCNDETSYDFHEVWYKHSSAIQHAADSWSYPSFDRIIATTLSL